MQDTINSVGDLLDNIDVNQVDDVKFDSENDAPHSAMTESPDIPTPAIQAHVAIQAEFANLNLASSAYPQSEEQIAH